MLIPGAVVVDQFTQAVAESLVPVVQA